MVPTDIPEVVIIEPTVFSDDRGWFMESFNEKGFMEGLKGLNLPAPEVFVQDNHSRSQRGVLRGLHFQRTRPQGKLVSVSQGSVYDVAVDINPESPTCGQFVGVELSDENHRQFWVPPGYAHGFCVLSDIADFQYKCTDLYYPDDEGGLIWNDPEVNIPWPIAEPKLSVKDQSNPTMRQLLGN